MKNDKRFGLFVDKGKAVIAEVSVGREPPVVRFAQFPFVAGTPSETATALRSVIKEKSFHARSVTVCLPHRVAAIKLIRVPSTDPNEIRSMATFQACRLMPFSPDEIVAGFETIETSNEGFSQILLTVVRREDVAPVVEVCRSAGLRVQRIILDTHALPAVVADRMKIPCLMVRVEGREGMVAIIDKQKPRFARTFSWDGTADSLAREAVLSMEAYQKESPFWHPGKIVWLGKGMSTGFSKVLETALNAPFELFEMPAQVDDSMAQSAYAGACASTVDTNLLPEPEQKRQVRETKTRRQKIFAGLVLSFGLAWMGLGWGRLRRQEVRNSKLEQEINALAHQAAGLEEKADRLEEARRSEGGAALFEILRALNVVLPPGVSLSGFSYERQGLVVLQGESLSLAEALSTVTALEKTGLFQKVDLRNSDTAIINGKDMAQFQIACELAGVK